MSNIANELKSIISRLETASVSTASGGKAARRRRQRQRRKQRANPGVVAPAVQNVVQNPVRRRNRRTREGLFVVSRCELVAEVTGNSNTVIPLTPDKFNWLANVSKSFERLSWTKMSVYWKAAVGTTTNGLIAYGVDWNSTVSSFNDRKKVLSLTPVADHPVWQSSDTKPLVLPSSKLMSRKEYLIGSGELVDKSPGNLLISCSATTSGAIGEIWIDYTVHFFGTQS